MLARYAADAAREVVGVDTLVGNALLRHEGVKVGRDGDRTSIELHVALTWGANAGEVGAALQERVVDTLARMTEVGPVSVDVVIDEFRPPAA